VVTDAAGRHARRDTRDSAPSDDETPLGPQTVRSRSAGVTLIPASDPPRAVAGADLLPALRRRGKKFVRAQFFSCNRVKIFYKQLRNFRKRV